MSYSGVLCLLGIRKVAQELRSEAVEVVQDVPRSAKLGQNSLCLDSLNSLDMGF